MRYSIHEAASLLARTPAALHALLSGLDEAWLNATEGPGTWSPSTIVAHLLTVEETNWIPRARAIVESHEDSPILPAFDRNAHLTASVGRPLPELLSAFAQARAHSLTTLSDWRLTDDQLARTGVHPDFGTITLRQLLSTWVAHDLTHLSQIMRVMASQYRDEVGPWRAYLRVLA